MVRARFQIYVCFSDSRIARDRFGCDFRLSKAHRGNDRFWRILLKKSKIAKPTKSRESRMLATSAAARLCRTDTSVGGRFCVKLMWSLTSQRVRRTRGPENFQSSTKRDFFNSIGREADIRRSGEVRKSAGSRHSDRRRFALSFDGFQILLLEIVPTLINLSISKSGIPSSCFRMSAVCAPRRGGASG
jgi:hypothetical protein